MFPFAIVTLLLLLLLLFFWLEGGGWALHSPRYEDARTPFDTTNSTPTDEEIMNTHFLQKKMPTDTKLVFALVLR